VTLLPSSSCLSLSLSLSLSRREFVFGLKSDLYSTRPIYRYPPHFYSNDHHEEEDDESHDKVIYSTAALGIVHDLTTNTQHTFCGHDDDITCIALAPASLGLVATGQMGRTPFICVWDCSCLSSPHQQSRFNHPYPVSDTGLISRIGKGFFQRGVCAVCFSYDGKFLCGIGCDDHHTLGIWEVVQPSSSHTLHLTHSWVDSNWESSC
jgi:hypothetical protein